MAEGKNKRLQLVFVLADILLVWVAYYLAVWVKLNLLGGIDNADMNGERMYLFILAYSIIVNILLARMSIHAYSDSRQTDRAVTLIFTVVTGGSLLLTIWFFISHNLDFSRVVIVLFWLFSLVFLELSRYLEQLYCTKNWSKITDIKKVIVVGNGQCAQKYINIIKDQSYPLASIIGYIGYEKADMEDHLGNYEDLDAILEKYNPNELVIALEPHETQFMRDVLGAAAKEGTEVQLIPLFNEFFPSNPIVETVGDVTMINLRSTPLTNEWNALLKRTVDVLGSLFLIILLSPVMIVAALGVWLSSPGPVFFLQKRVGLDKKEFQMYKFRSMRVNNEEESGWSRQTDPRRTRFGSFIRKYSIDELPQLFNVLKGDMSLVGPRPEIPYYVRQFKETVPLYLVRQQVRPGMTGWAQIHGLRGDTSIEDRVEYDIWYIENWTMLLDIKILIRTVFGGFINNES